MEVNFLSPPSRNNGALLHPTTTHGGRDFGKGAVDEEEKEHTRHNMEGHPTTHLEPPRNCSAPKYVNRMQQWM